MHPMAMNSRQLLLRICCGVPRVANSHARMSIARFELMPFAYLGPKTVTYHVNRVSILGTKTGKINSNIQLN
jgi:hypothetical protein